MPSQVVQCLFYGSQENGGWADPGCMRMHHESTFRRAWDMILVLLLLYMSLTLPVMVAFDTSNSGTTMFTNAMDICFLLDFLLAWFTTFEFDQELVTDFSAIAKNYLTGWFAIDLVSSIPLEWFPVSDAVPPEAFRVIKMLKLLKLLRVMRFGRILGKLQIYFLIRHSAVLNVRYFLGTLFLVHWMACVFFFVGRVQDTPQEPNQTWISSYLSDTNSALVDRAVAEQYVASFYWAMATATSIGYGDITPVTDTERIVTIFNIMIGVPAFLYILTNACEMLIKGNNRTMVLQGDCDEVIELFDASEHQQLTREVCSGLSYQVLYSDTFKREQLNYNLLKFLSPELRYKVRCEIAENVLNFPSRLPACLSLNQRLFNDVAQLINGVVLTAEDIIRGEGTGTEGCLCFLTQGSIDWDGRTLNAGTTFGERTLLGLQTECAADTMFAKTACDVFVISFTDMRGVLSEFPLENRCLSKVFRDRNIADVVPESEMLELRRVISTEQERMLLEACTASNTSNSEEVMSHYLSTFPTTTHKKTMESLLETQSTLDELNEELFYLDSLHQQRLTLERIPK